MAMAEAQQLLFGKRQAILSNLSTRNLWQELTLYACNLLGPNFNKYSVTTRPLADEQQILEKYPIIPKQLADVKQIPVLYLFCETAYSEELGAFKEGYAVYHDLDTGKVKHDVITTGKISFALLERKDEAVSLAGESDDLSPEDEVENWYMTPEEKYFWKRLSTK